MPALKAVYGIWSGNGCSLFYTAPEVKVLISEANCGMYKVYSLLGLFVMQFGTPVHEIGHALGMWHEQMRSDRDNSIVVNWDNVLSVFKAQYVKVDSTHNLVQYNFGSVMHYSPMVREL